MQLSRDLGADAMSALLPELKVRIERARGGKCERCWNYSEAVGTDATHPGLCERCLPVITGAGGMRKYSFVLSVAAIVLVLDQVTKWYIRRTVGLYESIVVLDSFFHITHVRNAGGAFSLFAGAPSTLRLPFFVLVSQRRGRRRCWSSCAASNRGSRLLLFALGAILGGALGNLTDRITSGEVTDFLDFHWHGWYWPAFNVADSFISTGMVILLLYSFLERDEGAKDQQA